MNDTYFRKKGFVSHTFPKPGRVVNVTDDDIDQAFRFLSPEPLFKVKLLHADARVPTKAYEDDLGWDVYSLFPETLWHGQLTRVQTGIAIQPRKGYGFVTRDRSSMANAQVFSHGGVFDGGFTGEVVIGLTCETPQYYIAAGDRVAQIIFVPIAEGEPMVVDQFEPTERGERKWGSSGK